MMKNRILTLITLLIFIFSVVGCVSNKKYSSLYEDFEEAKEQLATTAEENEVLKASNAELKEKFNKQLLKTDWQGDIIQDKNERITLLREKLMDQRMLIEDVKADVETALIDYDAEEIPVLIRGNTIHLMLPDWLLFPSGVAALDKKGKNALAKVAPVLKNNPDLEVTIEGHTDNVEVVSKYEDNWELSTQRALSVACVLIEDHGVDPDQVTVAGQGASHPLTSNDTPNGRAINRRTVIIIEPDMDELFELADINK